MYWCIYRRASCCIVALTHIRIQLELFFSYNEIIYSIGWRCIHWVNYVSANVKYKLYLATTSGLLDYDYTQPMGISQLSFYHLLTTAAVEVNFNENSYTVAESDGQVSVSLRIDGQFFVPVWAVVEISDGTATGGLCMSFGMYGT